MKRPALRWLILVPMVASVLIGFAAFAFYVERSVHSDLINIVDDELVRASLGQVAQGDRPGTGTAPPPDAPSPPATDGGVGDGSETGEFTSTPVFLTLTPEGFPAERAGTDLPFSGAELEKLSQLDGGTHTVGEFRVLVAEGPNGTTSVAALDLDGVNTTVSGLRRSLLIGAVVVGLVQAMLVWLIATSLTRPLTRMATTARRIARGELDTEIGEPSGSSETAGLATDLDSMLQQIRTTLDQSERSAAEATQARLDMQQFLADASHELRTPLTALKGYSDLYHGEMLTQPTDLDRAMGRIGSESERMTRLVNDMLNLARMGAVDRVPHEMVEVGSLFEDVAEDVRAAYPGIVLEFVIADNALDGPPQGPEALAVLGDRSHFHQAVLNLAANAFQHAGGDTPIRLEASRGETAVEIKVIDHGPGIDPKQADQVFLTFYRLDVSRSRDGAAGAGLGLSIVKKIVEDYGGAISVEQTPGGGATFVITLPHNDG